MRVRYAAAAGIALIAVAVSLFMLLPEKHVLATNGVHPFLQVLKLKPRERVCDTISEVPVGTGAVQLKASSAGGEVDRLTVKVTGGPKQRGAVSVHGVPNGTISVPVQTVVGGSSPARICIYNYSEHNIKLYGEVKRPDGEKIRGRSTLRNQKKVSMLFIDSRSTTWYSDKTRISNLYQFGHAGWTGTWTLWLAGLLAAAAAAVAMWRVTQDGERS